MRNLLKGILFLTIFSVGVLQAASPTAEPARLTGDILGSVDICSVMGIDRVIVYIPGRSYVIRPAPDGSFEFNFVPPGTYDLAFEAEGELVGTLSGVVVIGRQQTNLGSVVVCIDADGDGWDATLDCNDADSNINPDAFELCNAVDDNCNAIIDEGYPTQIYYRDSDQDGFGDPAVTDEACLAPSGFVANNLDCMDSHLFVQPGQTFYFRTDRGDLSYDYNCDTVEEPKFTEIGSCTLVSGDCVTVTGWEDAVPSCGLLGDTIHRCDLMVDFSGARCEARSHTSIQECR